MISRDRLWKPNQSCWKIEGSLPFDEVWARLNSSDIAC
jgi:hypothetical protein